MRTEDSIKEINNLTKSVFALILLCFLAILIFGETELVWFSIFKLAVTNKTLLGLSLGFVRVKQNYWPLFAFILSLLYVKDSNWFEFGLATGLGLGIGPIMYTFTFWTGFTKDLVYFVISEYHLTLIFGFGIIFAKLVDLSGIYPNLWLACVLADCLLIYLVQN